VNTKEGTKFDGNDFDSMPDKIDFEVGFGGRAAT
jgi:hypothetical protein